MMRAGILVAAASVALAGCSEGTSYAFPPGSAQPVGSVAGSAAWAVPPAPDPAVVKLATEVTNGCRFDEGTFTECAPLRKWMAPQTNAFQGHRADATLLDMLASEDERTRVLAALRPYWDDVSVLSTQSSAERILGLAERAETNPRVRGRLLDDVLKIDFGRLGMLDRLKQFVAHADATVRQEIPAKFLQRSRPVEGAIDLVGGLLRDAEESVRRAAFRELMSAASDDAKRPSICRIVLDAMDPVLETTDEIMTSFASAASCPDAPAKFVDRIETAMKKPATVSDANARMYPNVLRGICTHGTAFPEADPSTKKRAFDAAKSIAKAKSFDVYGARATAIDALIACDSVGALPVLQKLMQDPDPSVDQLAKDAYDRLTGVYYNEY